MEEIWKDIPGYEGVYMVSSLGRVKTIPRINSIGHYRKEMILSLIIGNTGRCNVSLYKDGLLKRYSVHRLVAQAFLGLNISDKNSFVCHKDDDPLNNRINNLFIGTAIDNVRDMISKGRRNNEYNERKKRRVAQLTKDGIVIRIWGSMQDIKNETGIYPSHICLCCKGKVRTAKGFVWKYA